jgi:outer membrane protein assembly factor BamB
VKTCNASHDRLVRLWLLFVVTAHPIAAAGQGWPQFRGPDGQGHSSERGLPLEWSESRNVAWKTPVPGRGWSSPVIGAGRVWLTTATVLSGRTSLRLLSYDAVTGQGLLDTEVFRLRTAELLNAKNSFASPTPVVEPSRIYVHFGAEGTAALSPTGEIIWKVRHEYQSQHGNGGSPVVHGDLLILNCDGFDQAFVVALDKHTGKTRWRTLRPQPWSQAYTTPLVIRVGERDQVVSVGAGYALAYDLDSGKEIWRVSYPDGFSNVPRPVFGNGLVYVTTGFQQPAILAVRPDGQGDVTRTHVAWRLSRGAPLTPSPLLVGTDLYAVTDAGIVSCIDAGTGDIRWQQRLGGTVSASPVSADGRVYFLDEDGQTTVVSPGPAFQRLATNVLEGPTLASMAVADGAFFIRTGSHLYRIGSAHDSGAGDSGSGMRDPGSAIRDE